MINREFVADGITGVIQNIKYVAQNYVDVVLSDGMTRELDKAQILKAFGLAELKAIFVHSNFEKKANKQCKKRLESKEEIANRLFAKIGVAVNAGKAKA